MSAHTDFSLNFATRNVTMPKESLFRWDVETKTRDACATRSSALQSLNEVENS